MTARATTTEVPYAAAQMFALVADIDRYPEFLPWCVALRTVERRLDDPFEYLTADMVVSYKVFRERFRSLVRLDPVGGRIDVDYVDGPFRTLRNSWAFADRVGGGSIVKFSISFEFRNFIMQKTAQAVFDKAFLKMSEAFVDRAHAVYGTTLRAQK